jgi:hypothetical protein
MIPSIFFYILGTLLYAMAIFLPEWSIYPPAILEGLTYIGSAAAKLNFIFDMFSLFAAFVFIFQFLAYYYLAVVVISIINFFRGSGAVEM